MGSSDPYQVIRENVGRHMAALRRCARMSQETLSRITNLDRSYLSKIECGLRNASIDVYSAIAQSLDVTLAELFEAADIPDDSYPSGIREQYWH